MKKTIILLFALILAFSSVVIVNAEDIKKSKEDWRFIHSRKVGKFNNIFFINNKNIKKRDNLLSFSLFKQLNKLPKKDVTKIKQGDEAFDYIIDKALKEFAITIDKSKTNGVIDCENSTVLTMNKTYYQPEGKVVIFDLYNNVMSFNGEAKQIPENLSMLRGWKPLSLYRDYKKVYDAYCTPKYKRKDLKEKIKLY